MQMKEGNVPWFEGSKWRWREKGSRQTGEIEMGKLTPSVYIPKVFDSKLFFAHNDYYLYYS